LAALSKQSATDVELKEKLKGLAAEPPAGVGPWPFIVVDTGPEGLFARSTPFLQANRLGYIINRSIVWADCRQATDFTPPNPINDVGASWVRIHWKNLEPSQQRFDSDPNEVISTRLNGERRDTPIAGNPGVRRWGVGSSIGSSHHKNAPRPRTPRDRLSCHARRPP
jgi:hypothetical protein